MVSIVPYAWGNLCAFVAIAQYTADTYHGSVVAAHLVPCPWQDMALQELFHNSLAKVRLHFTSDPLDKQTLKLPSWIVYDPIGLAWAIGLFGFVTLFLLPIPLVLYKYRPRIRAKSRYPTIEYYAIVKVTPGFEWFRGYSLQLFGLLVLYVGLNQNESSCEL